jgi:hypothetical protein
MEVSSKSKPDKIVCLQNRGNCLYKIQDSIEKGLCTFTPQLDVEQHDGMCSQYFPKFYQGD